jgi:hypothetical protein
MQKIRIDLERGDYSRQKLEAKVTPGNGGLK